MAGFPAATPGLCEGSGSVSPLCDGNQQFKIRSKAFKKCFSRYPKNCQRFPVCVRASDHAIYIVPYQTTVHVITPCLGLSGSVLHVPVNR
jgi:hypothetical protein